MQNSIKDIKKSLCKSIKSFWGEKSGTLVIEEITDIPYHILTIKVSLYQFMTIAVRLEHSTIGISTTGSETNFLICDRFDLSEFERKLSEIDTEVRLRIPDKFLVAKGW